MSSPPPAHAVPEMGGFGRRHLTRLAGGARRNPRAPIGLALVTVIGLLALIGPSLAPNSPNALVAAPYQMPDSGLPLGADAVGQDVLSQVLSGGRTILLEALMATLLGVSLGVTLGMATGASSSRLSAAAVRLNDTALALPQLVLTLLVLSRIGPSPVALTLVVAAFHIPLTARIVRAATLRVIHEDFVLAAVAIGLKRTGVLLTEVLPNISAVCFVELGIRFAISIAVLASLGYLGFGSTDVDWGRMIYENQGGLTIQPWGVIAPVVTMGMFVIGISLLTDGLSAAARRSGPRGVI